MLFCVKVFLHLTVKAKVGKNLFEGEEMLTISHTDSQELALFLVPLE